MEWSVAEWNGVKRVYQKKRNKNVELRKRKNKGKGTEKNVRISNERVENQSSIIIKRIIRRKGQRKKNIDKATPYIPKEFDQ